jgi:MFS transporter, PAT family, beta-lactamase induction signal transducer AmpG
MNAVSVSPLTSGPAVRFAWWQPLLWVPSLYLAMGIPFNVIMGGTAARMYKSLGYSDGQITVALGGIGLAWSLKPLWAAFLDMYRSKKFFVLAMELALGGIFTGIALSVPAPGFFHISIALLWVAAFASATQDICADGIYLTALDKPAQSRFAGVQGTFWVLGKLLATGALIWAMDSLREARGWSAEHMWQQVMLVSAGAMGVLAGYHFWKLPSGSRPAAAPSRASDVVRNFAETTRTFFQKRLFWGMIAFVFLYRLGEGLILMEGQLFLQSPVAQGGLGLSAGAVSQIDAVWGTAFGILGGLLGGAFAARMGLWRCLGILGLCLNVPHFTYVYLSHAAAASHGLDYPTIVTMVSIEKFGYGFGFVGNMIYMMQQLAPGRWTMTHYAFATSLMNLVLVPTNMISGPLAEWLGFSTFFVVVMFASVPSVWAAFKAPFPHRANGTDGGEGSSALDDPATLSDSMRRVQAIAGRASMFAMLHILILLVADSWLLGRLKTSGPGTGYWVYGVLFVAAALKFFATVRTWSLAGEAGTVARETGEDVYVRNARGARIAVLVASACSLGVLAFVGWRVF